MNTDKKKFIQDYLEKLNNEVESLYELDGRNFDQAENNLFDLILEIRNVFSRELPEIENAILIHHGTGIRDANSVIGLLKLFLINNGGFEEVLELPKNSSLDDSFISYASDILADTNTGLSGSNIIKYCNSYAIDFDVKIPISSSDFGKFGSIVPNKRTALYKNLQVFNDVQQFTIIKELTELPFFVDDELVKDIKVKLYTRYGNLAIEKIQRQNLLSIQDIGWRSVLNH